MDFRSSPERDAFRREAEVFFAEHVTTEMAERARATGTIHDDDLYRALGGRRWIGAFWPAEDGGLGLAPVDAGVLYEAACYAQAPIDGHLITEMAGYAILKLGTPEQRAEFIPKILAGDMLLALGYTEPDSGSDVAAAKTRAVKVEGGYRIDGAKMFTTMAHVANYVFLLARTDPDVPKHRGLSMFLVPLDAEGVEIRPIETFGGERTNATFYDTVFVPDSHLVGRENDGWQVITLALDVERASVGGYVGQAARLYDDLVDALWDHAPEALRSSAVRTRLADWAARIEAARALADRVYCVLGGGGQPTVEAAMTKLAVTDTFKDLSHEALDLVGPAALVSHGDPAALAGGRLEHAFRHSQVSTIYGGSNEIQRNIIAYRGLGLPRS